MTKIRTKKSPSYQLFKEIISEYINSDREKRISPVTQEAMIKIAYDLFLFLINFFSPPSQISTSSSKEMITKYENILSSIFVLDYKATSHAYQTSNHPTQLFEFLKLFPTIDASLLELLLIRITQFLDSVLINVHKMMETPEREKIDIWDLVETIKGLLKHDSPNVTFLVPLETVVSLSALVSLGVLQDSESAITSAVTLIRNANFLQTCHICGIRCSAIFCSICGSIACQTHIEIYNNPSVTSSKVICVKCTQDCSFCGKPLVDEKTLEINDKMVCVSCGRKACSSCSSMSPECEKCGNFICSDCQHVCFQCDGVFCPSCAQKFLLKCDICEKLSCNECQPNMAQDEWCKRLFCSFCDSQGEYCKICGSYLCLVCSQENKGFCSFCVEEVTRDIERFKADIKQNPNCIEKRIAFAALLAKLGEFQKAIEQLQKASQLDPSSISVWLELGDYYTKQPKIEEALICYKKARELAPFSPSVLKRIAKIYLEEGKIEKAKNLLEIAKKAAPKNITVIQSLATLWEALNNSDKAIELLNEAVKIKSNDETVWYDLGILYQRHGFFKEASKA
ncbi:MAG: tetratricopeptide repeat protein [Promethearchaeota archaeon]